MRPSIRRRPTAIAAISLVAFAGSGSSSSSSSLLQALLPPPVAAFAPSPQSVYSSHRGGTRRGSARISKLRSKGGEIPAAVRGRRSGNQRGAVGSDGLSSTSLGLVPSAVAVAAVPPVLSCARRIVRHGLTTFGADWKTYSLIPVIAAFVGWFTNYLAVQMIFYPIRWRGLPIRRVEGEPLGLLGWQGIVPAKSAKMADSMVNATLNELLSMEEVMLRLDPERVADILLPEAPKILEPIVNDVVPEIFRPIVDDVLGAKVDNWGYGIKRAVGRNFLVDLTVDVQKDIRKLLNLRNCVKEQVMADRSLLGRLFQRTGGAELAFLVDSGLWFGGLLGFIQMLVALYWDNPWTLSAGGALVGLATNWIALKLIFEPVAPRPLGPFVLQGLFIRRQREVAKDFANFFATKILTSRQVWNSILTDPTTAPAFANVFERRIKEEAKKTTRGIFRVKDSAALTAAVSKVTAALPQHLTALHGYVDETLQIESTLRTKMAAMSPVRFERVLHPVFEEDELTLILAGALLGFLAGLVQQGLASGALVLPTLPILPEVLIGCIAVPVLLIQTRNRIRSSASYAKRYLWRAARKIKSTGKKAKKAFKRRDDEGGSSAGEAKGAVAQ